MAKHSKWAKVKNFKGAADAKRASLFTKLARQVTVAARDGGGDPAFNFKLRSAIEQAQAASVPKDNIERAIKKGTGEIDSDRLEAIVYEGYGPGGVAILVEALTDNRNRTAANIKHAFSLHGGKLGVAGSVRWMFDRVGEPPEWQAKDSIEVKDPETRAQLEELLEALDDDEDVGSVYANLA